MVSILNKKNKDFEIKEVTDSDFEKYGRILDSSLFEDAMRYLETSEVPETGNKYVAHDEGFHQSLKNTDIYDDIFGYVTLQYGYVNGNNESLNALEFHKSSEINITTTPIVLFLGDYKDIHDNEYHSTKLEVFYVPEKTVIEINAGVLHFSPCKVNDEGFKCGVILPFGTNQEFVQSTYSKPIESKLLFKTNKWLLAHYENKSLLEKNAYPGLRGVNYKIKY